MWIYCGQPKVNEAYKLCTPRLFHFQDWIICSRPHQQDVPPVPVVVVVIHTYEART
jgi:hypothetical protein